MVGNCLSSCEENVAAVVRTANECLGDILNDSGTILYSSCATIVPGKYYFLGLNPGGADDGTKTIAQSLSALDTHTENAYLDEDWGSDFRSYDKGGHPLQKNFKLLFDALGEEPRSVCASNLIFSRSISEKGAGSRERADSCWLVHKAILEIVRPSAIITFGRRPFDFVIDKLGGIAPTSSLAGHGKWIWRYSILNSGEMLIGLPHLSRYSLGSNPNVVKEIKKLIG